ncbi:MAG TPA: hypothetical protein VFT10_02195, partial [Solirubrobacterales bacterium]|nr:hypothetical protein [Solirubrobacterales bacterium]
LEERADSGNDFCQIAEIEVLHLIGKRWLSARGGRVAESERTLVNLVELAQVVLDGIERLRMLWPSPFEQLSKRTPMTEQGMLVIERLVDSVVEPSLPQRVLEHQLQILAIAEDDRVNQGIGLASVLGYPLVATAALPLTKIRQVGQLSHPQERERLLRA